ncbi:Archaeal PaREP1/PaREP8 family [Pyrobaculum oguniense TE7]|uniref:Archaeal PaREP1/PaREP8 family n=1 Tax=Pyrobaculum oguniense (strain DSM 13380 / JCM 10595 / TE7) TaxID=698757 RepID=H6Q881_PYROT|nr:Archaeal PaREP1/PaREP8 family [Pyrobaculum oguniense TE7]
MVYEGGLRRPGKGLLKIAKDLEALGFKGVEHAARIALGLHRFAHNGFDPNFVDYQT